MSLKESRFTIKNINIIGTYGYNLPNNTDCTICRCSLNDPSLYNNEKGIDSNVVIGVCGHSFHQECIVPWLSAQNQHCPICSQTWGIRNLLSAKS
jgi:anaphase-promoting complex subunit 11